MSGALSAALDRAGLSDAALAARLAGLADAKKQLFFAHEGVIRDEREVEDNPTRLRAVELALKAKGHLVDRSLSVSVTAEIPVDLSRYMDAAPPVMDVVDVTQIEVIAGDDTGSE